MVGGATRVPRPLPPPLRLPLTDDSEKLMIYVIYNNNKMYCN